MSEMDIECPMASKRLMIREMVMENFKSYAGVQRVGPFHKSFSAVVGPNGSGKSNVIDAMLFVFGRRAKQLRFNKISELIHNSSNHRNCETARVTVHFQEIIDMEGQEFTVVPDSQFSVSRTAHRTNQSDYYINDRKVSTKDVNEKLKGLGIDLDNNRFLILQGEVEQISMMRPKAEDKNDTGLLEYLEDIIGTHKYVEHIEEGGKKMQELHEKRQGMIQRLKVVEKEREGLEGKKQEAEDFLQKQAMMLTHKASAARINLSKYEVVIDDASRKKGELELKLAYERDKHQNFDRDAKKLEDKFQIADKEHQALIKALQEAQKAFAKFEIQDAKLTTDLTHVKQKLRKTESKIESDAGNMKKLEEEVMFLEEEIPRCRAKADQLTEELGKQESVLEGMLLAIKGEVEGYHQQMSQIRMDLAPWEKRIGECSARIGISTTERDALARRAEDAKRRLEGALKGLAAAQLSEAAKRRQIQELEAAASRCRIQIDQHREELRTHRADEKTLEVQAALIRDKVSTLRSYVSSTQQQGGLVAALMTAKSRGEVTGVYGRLGDLGAIDKQYDVAVSTAVGALDYIVVETASDAQKCVEYLRRSQLGVATFLILEKQRHLAAAAEEKMRTPEEAPRLYDLVKVKDQALRPAFVFAMGNTLVASDLDQALRLAYSKDSRFKRVVTLQGQLISESGTMSGGGGRPSRGRMALGSSAPKGGNVDAKAAQAELKQAEEELQSVTQALKSTRDKTIACEQALKAAERQLGELESSVPRARMEVEAEEAKAHDIQTRLEGLKAATEVDAEDMKQISALEQQIKEEEASLAQLNSQSAGLRSKISALQQQIDGAGGDKLKKQKALSVKLQKDISDAESDYTRKGVQVKANAKSLYKLRKENVKDVALKAELEVEIVKIGDSKKALEMEAEVAFLQRAEREQAVEDNKTALEAVKGERDRFQRDFGIVRQTQLNIETKLEDLASFLKEQSLHMRKVEAEYESLVARLCKDFGQEQETMPKEGDLQGQSADDHIFKAGMLESELQKMNPDMEAIEAYRLKDADYNSRMIELEVVTAEREVVRRETEGMRKRRLDEFMAAFNTISMKLKEMYQMITLGGDAELELVDSLDPFSEGIVFSVRPPRKSWKNISNLSGGEKTLSSLSLVFALHHFKPTPLYVMDEIDAALDFKNVSIVGHYIKDRTQNAQFVIISLRNNMFELADRLVGIYKTDNSTKTVTINPAEFTVGTQDCEKDTAAKDQEHKHSELAAAGQAVTVT
ncbi:hypothetical protein CEUSTIGMA_g7326.t1 [Chlamydomonas eustigma]|uniref:Structural maintenance of chromosomes protein n=1 Tax=Chlamydomonas eustigma TaxID=1157962 RepID=A0A250XA16_9CHLO|nr:hypothetical protein CEUSTIGMA_g7326.t1 [Chlamydomonas eustigma]|eukprot:GAX79886.1 hypothetical protein CEUSTIGMA_g7326.t1 [Chlamydomonas eustigma]